MKLEVMRKCIRALKAVSRATTAERLKAVNKVLVTDFEAAVEATRSHAGSAKVQEGECCIAEFRESEAGATRAVNAGAIEAVVEALCRHPRSGRCRSRRTTR